MAIIVKKYGGSSVGSVERIVDIAKRLKQDHQKGDQLVLVVSAMARTTDGLFRLAHEITRFPSRRELDMLLTAGERISMSLLSLALLEEGISSISFTGSQSGIITDMRHGNARIIKVNAFRIHEELGKDKVVIVAGFQGVSTAKEITTLGRGGSDTSAVALACYLGAEKCEIYTDVDGVFTADPRLVPTAAFLPQVSYSDMLALANGGSKVMHPRAVEYAFKYKVPVEIRSSFHTKAGTIISDEIFKGERMETRQVTAIAHKDNLICFKMKLTENIEGLLNAFDVEIFKIAFINEALELYIDARYEANARQLFLEYGISVLAEDDSRGFVILVGLGLAADPAFLAKVIKSCKGFSLKRICHSERCLELIFPTTEIATAVQSLHADLIGDDK